MVLTYVNTKTKIIWHVHAGRRADFFCGVYQLETRFARITFKPVVHAIEVSHAACKDEFRRKSRLHSCEGEFYTNFCVWCLLLQENHLLPKRYVSQSHAQICKIVWCTTWCHHARRATYLNRSNSHACWEYGFPRTHVSYFTNHTHTPAPRWRRSRNTINCRRPVTTHTRSLCPIIYVQ